uniref:Uncharacterized protein n=1 Tax=Chromera velia CCMP2878 TaxID=1169474 RepID=A0A0G4GET9_9ALVE|eukprot:Cvel_21541.t1-p1 / transcript=Cvel_21541.t1 / gene=Cvel_21541 / organism=Chromera_velia_CCMP2878 / gene_product=hypothetical protein / transcript_product=hypothetical protein / location=Cvel_scaffold2030:12547-16452(+) / protein_length=71 / sequence_SO=supercontig / SO=protein_coding / is_pseudo=false
MLCFIARTTPNFVESSEVLEDAELEREEVDLWGVPEEEAQDEEDKQEDKGDQDEEDEEVEEDKQEEEDEER